MILSALQWTVLMSALGSNPTCRGNASDVQTLLVEMPTSQPDLREVGVAIKNTGDQPMIVVARQATMAKVLDPNACGELTDDEVFIELPPGASTFAPMFVLSKGDDSSLKNTQTRVGIPVCVDAPEGECNFPLRWTPNTFSGAARAPRDLTPRSDAIARRYRCAQMPGAGSARCPRSDP